MLPASPFDESADRLADDPKNVLQTPLMSMVPAASAPNWFSSAATVPLITTASAPMVIEPVAEPTVLALMRDPAWL